MLHKSLILAAFNEHITTRLSKDLNACPLDIGINEVVAKLSVSKAIVELAAFAVLADDAGGIANTIEDRWPAGLGPGPGPAWPSPLGPARPRPAPARLGPGSREGSLKVEIPGARCFQG